MFLALTMALSLMPAALAEGDEPADPNAAETLPQEEALLTPAPVPAAATDGYTEWTSTDSLPTSGTYRLTTDVTVTKETTVGGWASSRPETPAKVLTLDLNGHTITATGGQAFFVQVSGGLVIEDNKGGGKITNTEASGSSKTLIQINGGSFELKGGTLENTSSMGYALHLNSSSTATLSGGIVVNTANGGHVVYVNGTAAFTMEGGKVTQESTYSSSAAIYANNSATSISISGGEVVSKSMGVYAAFTPVSVTGGTFQTESYAFQTRHATINPADGNTVSVTSGGAVFYTFSESENKVVDGNFTAPALTKSYTQNDQPSTLAVSGGTFDIEEVAFTGDNSKITISGGKFTCKVQDQYLEGGLTQGQDGTVGTVDDVFAAELWREGEPVNRYPTLDEALNNAQDNDIVMLAAGKEISLSKPIEISNKVLTLDLNGGTIKAGNDFQGNQVISVKEAGNLTIMDASNEKTGLIADANRAIVISGSNSKVTIQEGKLSGNQYAVLVTNGASLEVSGGTLTVAKPETSKEPAIHVQLKSSLEISGGTIVGGQAENGGAVNALSSKVELSGNAKLTGYSGIALFNVDSKNQLSNAPDAVSSTLTMSDGTIEAKVFALSGNNTQSAGSVATISGGTLTANDGTAIYWPMEGELTVGGDAVITGGTGIEAKMGTITVKENAQIIGTAAYKADEPTNGGSSPEGSALLLTSQMYGAEGQYQTSNLLTVNIIGGTLTSQKGNAVTVYNTEENEVQTAQVTVSGGTFTAEKAAIISVTKGGNTVTTDGNTQTTSKPKTTLTVSGSVAPASIDANGSTAYFANVTQAIASLAPDATEKTQISVFGNSTISTDVELQKNITLVVAPGVQLTADVTSGESEMVVVTEQDANGNTVYKLVAKPENPEQTYVASITANGQTAYFDTLAAAVKTVQSGQTITLLKNSDAAETITISRAVTFTLDLKTFTMKDTIAAGSGFVLTRSGNTYTVSVYVPPVTPPQPDDRPSGGSDSSSSSDGDYIVSVDTGKHGTVTVSPKRADKGDTVTITVKPDKGYELDELVVTDKNGDAVKLKDKGNGKFSFTMPGSKVTVEAKFVKESASQLPFADVSADYWAYDEIAWAYENGYMNGTSATAFNPGGNVSRQQLWMILARLSGASPASMAEAREWAIGNGISDGSNPGGAISRQQMVATLYRYAKLMGYDTTGAADLTAFPDHASVADYAKEAMAWSVKNEIVGGTAQGTLNPAGTASRAQFAVILYRFVK